MNIKSYVADCIIIANSPCCNPAHRCCDCGQHIIPQHDAAGQLIDHDCR